MSFFYAMPTSGLGAGKIGWFNFGNLIISPSDTLAGLTGTLHDGSTVTFDLSLVHTSGQPYTFTISNITVLDVNNNPVPNFTVVLADAEIFNADEARNYQTDGGAWQLLTTLGSDLPTLTGLDTQIANVAGAQPFQQEIQGAYLLTTQAPSQLVLTSTEYATGRRGIFVGIIITRIRLQKYVAGRIDDADQFQLDITGTPADQVTTAGTQNGTQPQTALVYATPGDTYSVSESMALGSINQLSDYTTVVSAVSAAPAGSVPAISSLPISFVPALGDDVTYTIYNQMPYLYHKTVDKVYADLGDILTYTVCIPNPNPYPITDVRFTDPLPAETTYLGELQVDKDYTGTDPVSGIVVTDIAANDSVTISWKVRINTVRPFPASIVNVGYVDILGENSGVTSFATTDIRTAYVTMSSTVDKAFAQPGEVLSYTLTLHNAGNVVASDVALTVDALPTGATLVQGSLAGASGAFPVLKLNAPLAAGGTATVSYQVKLGAVVPAPNPIATSASAVYHYTVNPAQINGETGTAQSNSVITLVQDAQLSVVKSADRMISYVGETITYQLAAKNTGNIPVSNVEFTDALTVGTVYVLDSLVVSVPATGDPTTTIALTNPIAPGEVVAISFQVAVAAIPNPNPIQNTANAAFTYTVDPQASDGESGSTQSNVVVIPVFRNNFRQQINDLIHSVAQQQAALAALANAEGAKIQRIAAMPGVTPEVLLCLNKSVANMMDSITMLEAVLKQKLGVVSCQIDGETC